MASTSDRGIIGRSGAGPAARYLAVAVAALLFASAAAGAWGVFAWGPRVLVGKRVAYATFAMG